VALKGILREVEWYNNFKDFTAPIDPEHSDPDTRDWMLRLVGTIAKLERQLDDNARSRYDGTGVEFRHWFSSEQTLRSILKEYREEAQFHAEYARAIRPRHRPRDDKRVTLELGIAQALSTARYRVTTTSSDISLSRGGKSVGTLARVFQLVHHEVGIEEVSLSRPVRQAVAALRAEQSRTPRELPEVVEK
jgi:hypothetical protein